MVEEDAAMDNEQVDAANEAVFFMKVAPGDAFRPGCHPQRHERGHLAGCGCKSWPMSR